MHNTVKTKHTGVKNIPPRTGKTQKDRESGKINRTIKNRLARASEQKSVAKPKKNG